MSVPPAAIEAGSRAAYAHVSPQHAHDQGWDELPPAWQRNYRNEARAILEAAAPHLMAAAWGEGAKAQADAYGMNVDTLGPNPYRKPTP